MLEWFITDQVEEEETPKTILPELVKIGDGATGLYMFDLQLRKK